MFYVIQVETGRELQIAGKLRGHGIKALVPLESRSIRSGGAWTNREYVLFTGYIFLDMKYNASNYYLVKKTPGVVRFLGDSRNPSRLSYLEAEWISTLTGKDNAPIEPTVVRKTGDKYQVVSGVLGRFENRITKYDKRQRRATFEITLCGEKKEVQLSIMLEEETDNPAEAGADAPEYADRQILQEAT